MLFFLTIYSSKYPEKVSQLPKKIFSSKIKSNVDNKSAYYDDF